MLGAAQSYSAIEVDMTAIIASAKGKFAGEDFVISIFSPELAFLDCDEYECRFEITGRGIDYKDRSIGFDSMQALILSIKMIGSFINDNDEFSSSLTEWDGDSIGIPTF